MYRIMDGQNTAYPFNGPSLTKILTFRGSFKYAQARICLIRAKFDDLVQNIQPSIEKNEHNFTGALVIK